MERHRDGPAPPFPHQLVTRLQPLSIEFAGIDQIALGPVPQGLAITTRGSRGQASCGSLVSWVDLMDQEPWLLGIWLGSGPLAP